MKRYVILVWMVCLVGLYIQAQDTQLTLETSAGNLHKLLTEEQQKSVTDLTLTGSMDNSDFYFIRDKMSKLKLLDLKEVNNDTIPEKAFYHLKCCDIYLPKVCGYIESSALESDGIGRVSITGPFPELGANVFGYDNFNHGSFCVAKGNEYCKEDGESILSMDGLTYYYYMEWNNNPIIPEGVETIGSRAFDGASIWELEFPSTLKLIKAFAFANIKKVGLARTPHTDNFFLSKSNIPPVLEPHVFDDTEDISEFILVVPCDPDVYRQADAQWLGFKNIRFGRSGIANNHSAFVTVSKERECYMIHSENQIVSLEVFEPSGNKCYSTRVSDTSLQIPIHALPKGITMGLVLLSDGTVTTIKMINE